jgi:hypothetical protein
VLDGAGHLEWSGDGLSPTRPEFCATDAASSCLTTFRWNGSIEVTVDEATVVTMDQFTVTSIVARQRPSPPFAGLASWEVTANGQSFTGSDPDLFEAFIDTTGLALSNLPNPSGSLTALTEADLARLALGFGPEFGFDLIQETLAANVGDHTHHMPCGTATVTYDAERLPHVENEWSSCNFATMILDGSFRADGVDSTSTAIPAHCAWTFRATSAWAAGTRGRVDDPSVDRRGDPRRFSGKHHGHVAAGGTERPADLAGHDPGRRLIGRRLAHGRIPTSHRRGRFIVLG